MGKFSEIIFRSTSENSEEMHPNYFLYEYAPSEPLFQKLKILNLEKLVIQRISLKMFKCSIGIFPSIVSALFQYKSVIHIHNTRRSKFFNIHVHIGRSEATYTIELSLTVAHIFGIISLKMFPQMFHTPVLKI